MAGDAILQEIEFPAPVFGIRDGYDDSAQEYDPRYTPDSENMRFSDGTWKTRKGSALFTILGGSGDVRLLADHYTAAGARIRLAARGNTTSGILYDYLEGTDSSFNAVSGGTGLGGATHQYFTGDTLNDNFYLTDRNGALKRYTRGAALATVAQPVAPGSAPTVKARPYAVLDAWAGSTPFSWTESATADYRVIDGTASAGAPPGGGIAAQLEIRNSSAGGDTITRNVTNEAIASGTIAYWLRQSRNRYRQQFEFGLNIAGEFTQTHRTPQADTWYPVFVEVGNLAKINYKRFRCINSDTSSDFVSTLYLPGRLQGLYRWVYTHYNPTTGGESEPSPISNSGAPLDLSIIGTSYQPSTANAFNKSAALTFTSDAGTDASTTKIRIYRNGGVPALTTDSDGREVWCRVGEINDQSTTLASSPAAGATSFTVTSATGLAVGDTLVLDKGLTGSSNAEEFVTITGLAGAVVTIGVGLLYAHTTGTGTVQIAFLDNVANEAVDRTLVIQRERDDPPSAAMFVRRSPDGRLWIFGYSGKPTGVAVSNRSTPDHPTDYEVFPDGVDPLTRADPLQGWRFEINGDVNDEEIMWGGFFHGRATILTRQNLYVIDAQSQADWGPFAVQRLTATGCIARDTVAEVNGALYWVAPGPQVLRWDGQGMPVSVSHQSISTALSAAPTAYWKLWFARAHPTLDGHYYKLYIVPSGATTPTDRYDLNVDLGQGNGAWERSTYRNAGGTKLAYAGASVRGSGTDVYDLYQITTTGSVMQTETGSDDAGVAITIAVETKRYDAEGIGCAHSVYVNAPAATDALTLTVTGSGSEYGERSRSYTLDISGSNDVEARQRLHRDIFGKWLQLRIDGTVSNRPSIDNLRLKWWLHRRERSR